MNAFAWHRAFVGCEINSVSFQNAVPLLVNVYTIQVLSADASMIESDKVFKACKVSLKKPTLLESEKRADSWTAPPGLVPVQTSSLRIMHFLRKVYMDATLHENCWHIPLSK